MRQDQAAASEGESASSSPGEGAAVSASPAKPPSRAKVVRCANTDFVGNSTRGTAAEITPISQIAENNYKVCDLILDLSSSYGKLVRKKRAA